MVLTLRLALILILFAGSVIMAPSRGQTAGVMQITICADDGPQTLTLDARGNPVASHHPCPDCLPGLAFGPLPATDLPQWAARALPLSLPTQHRIDVARIAAIRATARGPPVSI